VLTKSQPPPPSWILPLTLFLLSFILRFLLISKGPYELDCLNLILKAEQSIQLGKLQYLNAAGSPLAVLLGVLFIKLTNFFSHGDSVFAINLMSVSFGSGIVPLHFILTKNLFNQKAAIFSALMVSFVPVLFLQSLFGITITIFLFFILLGFCFLTTPPSLKIKAFMLSGLCFGLAAAVRGHDAVLILPAIAWALIIRKKGCSLVNQFFSLTIFIGIIVGTCTLFYLPTLIDNTHSAFGGDFIHEFNYSVTQNFLGIFSSRLPFAISELITSLTPAGFIIALIGLVAIGLKNRATLIFLVLWIAVPLLFYGNIRATCQLRYLSMMIPPLIIAQSYIFQYSPKNKTAAFLKILSFIAIVAFLYQTIYPIAYARHKNAVLPDFARWIDTRTESNAKIIVADEGLFIQHYSHREILYRPTSVYGITREQLMQFKKKIDQLLSEEIPVYITLVSVAAYNKNEIFSDFINTYYKSEWVGKHLYESWHLGAAHSMVFNSDLYRMSIRIPASKND
jgi:hypothetical protein